TVTAVNDAPQLAVPSAQTIPEDSLLVFDTNRPIVVSDVDAGSGALRLSLVVSNGSVQLSTTNGLTFISGANSTASLVVEGTLDALNTALDGLIYRGAMNFNGQDTLVGVINDRGNTGQGGNLTDSKAAAITVPP